jgi:plasmid maintenance system antidote protein VapI
MHNTMDLYAKALAVQHAAAWARDMNITPAALSIAKKQRRLSPVLAGNIAMKLGEDPEHWIAIAALEAEPDSELLARLKKSANSWRKR